MRDGRLGRPDVTTLVQTPIAHWVRSYRRDSRLSKTTLSHWCVPIIVVQQNCQTAKPR